MRVTEWGSGGWPMIWLVLHPANHGSEMQHGPDGSLSCHAASSGPGKCFVNCSARFGKMSPS